MKTKLLFSFVLYFCLFLESSPAQNYTSFPDSNAVWSVLEFTDFYPDSTQYQTKLYGLFNDTIINTMKYNKLYFNDGLIDSIIQVASSNTSYLCAIRQDTLLKKVYFIPKDSINELVLYDFSINAGDTFFVYNEIGAYVEAICYYKYPSLIDGEVKNIFDIKTAHTIPFFHTWAEGIGNIRGLFETFYYFSNYKAVMCLTVNDTICYKFDGNANWGIFIDTSIYKSCYNNGMIITDNTVLEIFKNEVCISTNPLINSTLVTIPEIFKLNKITIDIFDLQGRKIKEFQTLNEHKLSIYRTDFIDGGLYFVRIKSNDYLKTIKLLVQ